MKWHNFITMIMGSISGILFALGMCMGLLPEWNMMTPGIILGLVGAIGGLITWLVHRRLDGKAMIRVSLKTILLTAYSVTAVLIFGISLSLTMVGGMLVAGVGVGIVAIVMLIALVPMIRGIVR